MNFAIILLFNSFGRKDRENKVHGRNESYALLN